MKSDGRCAGRPVFEAFHCRHCPTEAEAEKIFAALAEGGQVQMPLARLSFAAFPAWWPTGLAWAG